MSSVLPEAAPGASLTSPRPMLDVSQVALRLGGSTPSVWRWARTVPGFPQPERYRAAGRNMTRWYADEVEAFARRFAEPGKAHLIDNPLRPFEPADADALARGLYIAFLLDFSIGPDPSPEEGQSLFAFMERRVTSLEASAPPEKFNARGYPLDAELNRYLQTLRMCREVLEGRAAPEIRERNGFANARGLRRGVYSPDGGKP